ncbi:MAG: hypothetical protein JRH16_19285 [Deltaproteobacteria bacterium]|nr:hypothetical protein [Deltaproteobacteria bacterium]
MCTLNTTTRIVFDGGVFQGLVLPNNVTGFENLSAFGLTGVDFESSGFLGPDFKFNLGTPVVEGTFSVSSGVPLMGPVGTALLLVALGAGGMGAARRTTPRRILRR